MTPHLSTHVLDTQQGAPAAGVWVAVFRVDGDSALAVARTRTNDDGRIPDLLGVPLEVGAYRLEFAVGEYARARSTYVAPFFETIAVTVSIADLTRSYHVPLLLAPFGCTTYRGS